MSEGLISVILPVYNVKEYLRRCLDSLINQTYRNIEICLIDDGSSDGSELICEEYAKRDNRVSVFHQRNSGPSIARNKGLELAKGEYLFFMDSDDYLSLDAFDILLNELKAKDADISCAAARIIYDDGTEKKYLEEKEYILDNKQALEHCMFHNTIGTVVWAKLYKRTMFDGVKFPDNKNAEDEYVVYRAVGNSNRVVYTGRYLYSLFSRAESLGGSGKNTSSMWYFEAWCMRTEYLREKQYFDLADRTIDLIVRELYKKVSNGVKLKDIYK